MLQQSILQEVQKASYLALVDPEVVNIFLERIRSDTNYVRSNNQLDHFCVYFLPVNLSTKSAYLGKRIKSEQYLPPGGHIEEDEGPEDTVRREFYEELDYILTAEKISLFSLSRTDIHNHLTSCRLHYDIWYYIDIEKKDFHYNTEEFETASWFGMEKAIESIQIVQYKDILRKLNSALFKDTRE